MLYVVAGNGTGTNAEITGALKDLRDRSAKADEEFWLLVEAKDDPTKTDQAIYAWLSKNEVWFEAVTSTDASIDGAQESVHVEDVYEAMLERINDRAQDNEGAAILILPVDPEGTTDEDETLMGLVEAAIDADVEVFQLNGEMAKITLDEAPDEEPEEAPVPTKAAAKKAAAPAKKAPAKKAAPVKAVAKKAVAPAETEEEVEEAEADEEAEAEAVVYTAEELAKMSVAELGAVARAQGIDTKGLGKKDLIAAIQQVTATAVAEDQAAMSISPPESNGEVLVVVHLANGFVTKLVPMEAAQSFLAD